MKKNAGFTLVELMIVVAIIAIIAAIAIPSLARARTNANESSAQANLKALCGAQVSYSSAHGNYGTTLQLIDSTAGPKALSNDALAVMPSPAPIGGYIFSEGAAPTADTFSYVATPSTPGTSGTWTYTITESGEITRVAAL